MEEGENKPVGKVAMSNTILKKRITDLIGGRKDGMEEMKKELYDVVKEIFEKHGVNIF